MHATELNCAKKGQLHIGPQKGQNSRRQLTLDAVGLLHGGFITYIMPAAQSRTGVDVRST